MAQWQKIRDMRKNRKTDGRTKVKNYVRAQHTSTRKKRPFLIGCR